MLVFILALNFVADDNRRNRIAIQDGPRDHGRGVCDVGNLDVSWLRRENWKFKKKNSISLQMYYRLLDHHASEREVM